ncbi:DUF4921 family protein [Boudabousia marimammalium]|uniref:DUF4921 domain-containing protein n=1 Tax=Boudabousia marimammalium TaxID=156892 RepID=A0A1Q5PTI3_9ACTO|nr:DUF4921 family protein [Boudabousia marimammalium]OKL50690.1 DUF4921 domain-containing protein [Boudabousia marimammalium]
MPDGTVKQRNPLTGTQVWTVPGRAHRPISMLPENPSPIDADANRHTCAFCTDRYLETPPEKSRLVRDISAYGEVSWRQIDHISPSEIFRTTAAFRRIPNLFEIVSYTYWNLGHGHQPSEEQRRLMAQYLGSSEGYDHVINIITRRLMASGMSEEKISAMSEPELLSYAYGFFAGGHDVIVARRHFVEGATNDNQLASAGTLSPEEHYRYTQFTIDALKDLYTLNENVKYVAAFQNWLRPAGASFDHLHKQLVAIDERPVQLDAELSRLRENPDLYEEILHFAVTRGLVIAQNPHAVAIAGFGHRYPTLAVWPLGPIRQPWEYSEAEVRGVSDLLHAMHKATGADVPSNEEWYHCPPRLKGSVTMRWRLLLKWRISTLAGFEGGTRIYLNTLDPWTIRDRMVKRLLELREESEGAEAAGHEATLGKMDIGDECRVTMDMLK